MAIVSPVAAADSSSIARKMLAEDARWITDALLSSSGTSGDGIVPLLFLGHSARIVYEGSRLIRSRTPGVGLPVLARRLPSMEPAVAKARHATKLFDDSARPYETLLNDMGAYLQTARSEFLGNARFRWATKFEKDLGTFCSDRRILGITPTVAYRMGETPSTSAAVLGKKVMSYSRSQGKALAVLAEADGGPFAAHATLRYDGIRRLSLRDRRSSKYLRTRYEPTYPEALKLVLLHVEGDLNTASVILPESSFGHTDAAFRARVITTYHALNTLASADKANLQSRSRHVERLRALLKSPEWLRLCSTHGRQVRNRCMHYEIQGAMSSALDPNTRMNGIVEALADGRPFDEYLRDINVVLEEATLLMNGWVTR